MTDLIRMLHADPALLPRPRCLVELELHCPNGRGGSLQGARNTWFCGSYFGAGLHEDALQAGLAVARRWAASGGRGLSAANPTGFGYEVAPAPAGMHGQCSTGCPG